jgi:hypothetical protein
LCFLCASYLFLLCSFVYVANFVLHFQQISFHSPLLTYLSLIVILFSFKLTSSKMISFSSALKKKKKMMNIRLAATLEEAESYITSVSFAPRPLTASSNAAGQTNLWTVTTSEDDTVRLYDLNATYSLTNQQQSSASNNNNNVNNIVDQPLQLFKSSYSFPEIGTHKCIFTQGNSHCLLAPRNRSDFQIYAFDLESGQIIASYQIVATPPAATSASSTSLTQATSPWFSSLVVHPTAPGVFATSGENSPVYFCHASVSSPIARLSSINFGRSVVEFSPNGNNFAVGDRDNVSVYDWRKLGQDQNAGPVSQFKIRDILHASRWLTDVGSVSGLHFHPNSSSTSENGNKLLISTSRYVVRTIDYTSGATLQTFGASGAAASHLPNERPSYFAHKRSVPTAARFSPIDGRYVSCGTCMGRVTIFDAKTGENNENTSTSSSKNDDDDSAAESNNSKNNNNSSEPATLTHVLFGKHNGAVSVTEWCPYVPALVSTCRTMNLWRLI